MGIGAPISRHCVVLGVGQVQMPLFATGVFRSFWFLNTVVSGKQNGRTRKGTYIGNVGSVL